MSLKNKSNSEAIDALRFPLIILVIFIHAIPPQIYPLEINWDALPLYRSISSLISHHLGRVAVPCFFLFSGYFYFSKISQLNTARYIEQLTKRSKTLLIPYLLWNICLILAVLVKNYLFKYAGQEMDHMYLNLQQSSWYEIFWVQPFNFPLWYLRDLICMTIIAPVFYLLFTYMKWISLVLISSIYLLTLEVGIPGFSSTAVFFFGMGAYCALSSFDLSAAGEHYKRWKILIAVSLLCVAACFAESVMYEFWIRLFTVAGVFGVLAAGHIIIQNDGLTKRLKLLAPSVFFIYAIHEIYLINWIKGGFQKLEPILGEWSKLMFYFVIPIITIIICLICYNVMQRFFPAIFRVLVGGRKKPILESKSVYGA